MIWCVSVWNKIQIKKYYEKVVITSVELSCGGMGNKMIVIITQIYHDMSCQLEYNSYLGVIAG